ncbi:two-component sensor histidine kinase [Azorhizobium oxalatiphilum]|uniref:histidine kinase n=1 Tax=Azorhizobium oxalatiphilum TaxID=980631 RepID=A0A917F795_9HYPH|nr:ATP-binding protein [Azorhizobium oxalatiphilum]GGF50815.1 two-component sensor histidine kinase [Azorhizobium oxalatiphilum]
MRLRELPRTTSFRLALFFLLLFGGASVTLFGVLYVQMQGFLVARTDEWLLRERVDLSRFSPEELRTRLQARALVDPSLERAMAIFDPAGRRLDGTALPAPATIPAWDTPFDFAVALNGKREQYRGIARRLETGDTLLIAQGLHETDEFNEALVRAMLIGGILTVVLGLGGAVFVGVGAVRRLDAVTLAIRKIVAGDLSNRLPTRGTSDDVDRLVHVVNGMLEEIDRLMREVKGVCDNIAHDLRTPLTRLLGGLERVRRHDPPKEAYGLAVDDAITETKGILKTFAALLRISEVEDGARRSGFVSVDLAAIVQDAVDFYEPLADEKQLALSLSGQPVSLPLMGDASLLFEAVGNLLDNAIKFTPPGGHVRVELFVSAAGRGVSVADDGPGIPPAEREAVLRRFYRTEKSRSTPGSGLGLSLVAGIAGLHGMALTLADNDPGCRITLAKMPDA